MNAILFSFLVDITYSLELENETFFFCFSDQRALKVTSKRSKKGKKPYASYKNLFLNYVWMKITDYRMATCVAKKD